MSVVNDPEYFQKRVQALIHSWQFDRYQFTAALGDGGDFIWEMYVFFTNHFVGQAPDNAADLAQLLDRPLP